MSVSTCRGKKQLFSLSGMDRARLVLSPVIFKQELNSSETSCDNLGEEIKKMKCKD
jgi:hypothetical protein